MYQKRRLLLFDRFLDQRSKLIDQYDNKEISKRDLVLKNYQILRRMNLAPFIRINSYEKGIYNYQYYNTLAKYYKLLADEERPGKRQKRKVNTYRNKCDHYYKLKDMSSLKLLEFLDFKNIRAYFIKTESQKLKYQLFEIVLYDYDKAIFHSMSTKLLDKLRQAGVFDEEIKKSAIADYINETY